jgi:hypothetical protein
MNDNTLRKEIHRLVDTTSESRLEQIYQMLHDEGYSEEFKIMLEEEFEDYQNNHEVLSSSEINSLVEKVMSSKK